MNILSVFEYRSANIQTKKSPYFSIIIQNDYLYSEQIQPLKIVPNFENNKDENDIRSETTHHSKTSKKSQKNQKNKSAPSHCTIQTLTHDFILGFSSERGRLCIFFKKRSDKFQKFINEGISNHPMNQKEYLLNENVLNPPSPNKKSNKSNNTNSFNPSNISNPSMKSKSNSNLEMEEHLLFNLAIEYLDSFSSPMEFLKANYNQLQYIEDPLTGPSGAPSLRMLILDIKHGLYFFSNEFFKKEEDQNSTNILNYPVVFELLDGEYCIDNISDCIINNWNEIEIPKLRKIAPLFAHLNKSTIPFNVKCSKLFNVLCDDNEYPIRDLPNSSLTMEWEKKLSPIFVANNFLYGTRMSTLISMNVGNDQSVKVENKQPTGARIQKGFEKLQEENYEYIPNSDSILGRNIHSWLKKRKDELYQQEFESKLNSQPSTNKTNTSNATNTTHASNLTNTTNTSIDSSSSIPLQTLIFQNIYNLDLDQTNQIKSTTNYFNFLNENNLQVPIYNHFQYYNFDFKGPQKNQKKIESKVHLPNNVSKIEQLKAMQLEFLPRNEKKTIAKRPRPLSRQSSASTIRPVSRQSTTNTTGPSLSRSSSRLSIGKSKP